MYTGTLYHNPTAGATLVQLGAGPRAVHMLDAYNGGSADAYVQMFAASSTQAVTLGTTVPTWVIPVPKGGGNNPAFTQPLAFNSGLVIAVTTTPGGSVAPAVPIVLSVHHTRA